MKQLQQDNQLEKLVKSQFFGDDIHPILWRGIVVDVDTTGNNINFDTHIKGALRIRIKGLHDFIDTKDELKLLPIVLPLFFQSGFNPNIPEIGNEVFVQFENLEPIGQSYWLTVTPN